MAVNFIPEKFYVARTPRPNNPDEILGFMQPMHKEGFAGRKDTADRWAGCKLDPIEVENKPMSGFSLTENKRRFMNKNVIWRVLHPLGFEFEITSDNFSDFLMEIDMKKGIIQTPMVFVRRKGENYLTFEGSSVHKKAVAQATIEAKVSVKDLQIGDHFTLKSGDKGVYLGALHMMGVEVSHKAANNERDNKPTLDGMKSYRVHLFHSIASNGAVSEKIRYESSLKVISIDKKAETPGLIEDTLKLVREASADPKCVIGFSCTAFIFDVKPLKLADCTATIEPFNANTTVTTAPVIHNESYDADYQYLIKLQDDDRRYFYSYDTNWGQGTNTVRSHYITEAEEYELADGTVVYTPMLAFKAARWRENWTKTSRQALHLHKIEEVYIQKIQRA